MDLPDDLGLPKVTQPVFQHDIDNCISDNNIKHIDLLTAEQHKIFETVVNEVGSMSTTASKSRAFFVDGPGGTGKTMLYNTLIAYFRMHHIPFASSAWTGIAATLLTEGRTVHSLFKLPVPIIETSTCNVSPTSVHAQYLRERTVFIVDEASMVPKHALKAIDLMLRDITGLHVLF